MASVHKQHGVTDLIAMQEGRDILADAFVTSSLLKEIVSLLEIQR